MRKILIALMLIATMPANAETPKQYTLTVTPQDIQVIGTALAARPFSEVRDLFQRLEQQISVQNAPPPDAEGNPKPEGEKR